MTTSAPSPPRKLLDAPRPRAQAPNYLPRIDGSALMTQNRRLQDLHSRVVASLADSGYAALASIGCDIDHNRVILRGVVPSYHLKQLAQVYASRVEGIGRVDNRLEVRGRRPC